VFQSVNIHAQARVALVIVRARRAWGIDTVVAGSARVTAAASSLNSF